ncbi:MULTISPECIES: pyridoxal phosphate-dependent aminotransferase [Hydrogenophaga]|uniref:Aminotransferase n=1 Tax=Hydrogenophaga intermedia TaxID=65786 RepID=A0A1L1PP38_HYDIT|nr:MULTISPECIES: pyridoxal phosphate-dependent aminotransferase [Hydrogenophaga]AOS79927.1 aspartate aminotransferase [Hydrogenophaga sp. PBC]TMU75464.1 pyridoxal phosphate-dependent aminotransferase [Hydrogenophaga intermedia]CDN87806.1 Aspartate aminotransferase [Hydrogenophaga intermedia]
MRKVVAGLEGSRIREVANEGIGREGVLKFWFGESDEVTPEPIRQAAIASLQAGETFYAHNLGLPELREAIAGYTERLHPGRGPAHWFGRIAVTSGGVNGLMLAAQALVNAGDEVVVLTPAWPNLVAQPQILGARVRSVSLVPRGGAWTLDLHALRQAVTPATRALIINAPANPTGFTLAADQQRAILAHCRATGTWIVADEVYERLYFEGDTSNGAAPSFLDVAEPDDRLIVAHSFSKSFLMTGWRLGWLVLPAALIEAVGKLIEFNTSCAPVFVQRGAIAAIAHGDAVTPALVAHLRRCRDTLVPLLQALPGVELATPRAGMYAFFRLPGQADCLDVAKRLVREAGLGLAPGSAFAPEAAGWLRWCFASQDVARLEEGVRRLRGWLDKQGKN